MTVREWIADLEKQFPDKSYLEFEISGCAYGGGLEIEPIYKSKNYIHAPYQAPRVTEGPYDPRPIGHCIQVCHE